MTEPTDCLTAVLQAFPPPADVPPADWDAVERQLGLRLPTSYKALCDAYGDVLLDPRGAQLELLAPQATRPANCFPDVALAENASLRSRRSDQLASPESTAIPDLRDWRFFPEAGGLLPWAWTGGALTFLEVDPMVDPEGWRIVAPGALVSNVVTADLVRVPERDIAAYVARLLVLVSAPAGAGPDDVEESWTRIEAVLAADVPDGLAGLRPGADESYITIAEAELGVRLPEPYRRSVMRHDGQDPRAPWLVDGGQLCSLSDLLHDWREWNGMQDAGELDAFAPDAKPDPEIRREQWWRRGWLPFVSQDGDHLVLDLDPAPVGQAGQIFAFSHESGAGRLAAPDFGVWLRTWAEELEAGVALPRPSPVGDNDSVEEGADDAWDDEDDDWDAADEDDTRTWPRSQPPS